jgi:hypothetical protein
MPSVGSWSRSTGSGSTPMVACRELPVSIAGTGRLPNWPAWQSEAAVKQCLSTKPKSTAAGLRNVFRWRRALQAMPTKEHGWNSRANGSGSLRRRDRAASKPSNRSPSPKSQPAGRGQVVADFFKRKRKLLIARYAGAVWERTASASLPSSPKRENPASSLPAAGGVFHFAPRGAV